MLVYKYKFLIDYLLNLKISPKLKIQSIDYIGNGECPVVRFTDTQSHAVYMKRINDLYKSSLLQLFSTKDIALIGYTFGQHFNEDFKK